MWPSARAGSSPMKSPEEGFAGCSDSLLASPAPMRASFSELGSHCVTPEPTYLLGLRSFQQPPAGCQGGCSQEGACRGHLSLLFTHTPEAVTQHPVGCVLAGGRAPLPSPQALRAGTRGAVSIHPWQHVQQPTWNLFWAWVTDLLWLQLGLPARPVDSFPAPACWEGIQTRAHFTPDTHRPPTWHPSQHLAL